MTKNYRYPIIHYNLTKTFPPLFKPHPKLNPETGRVLSRPRGGERGLLDWYEESEVRESWRNEDGLGNVLKVIIRNLEVSFSRFGSTLNFELKIVLSCFVLFWFEIVEE